MPIAFDEEPLPPPALRRYFARHNQQAILLALFSLVAAAVLWGLVYVFVYWFALVAVTVARSFNPATLVQVSDPNLLGPFFVPGFAGAVVLWLAAAVMVRRHVRLERLREQRHYFIWVAIELMMAVPNVTFAVFGNLSAITRLRRKDAIRAWRLLERMQAEGGHLDIASLRLEIDDEKALNRVLFALQLVGLIGLREKEKGWYLVLRHPEILAPDRERPATVAEPSVPGS